MHSVMIAAPRALARLVVLAGAVGAVGALSVPTALVRAQQSSGGAQHDHRLFACVEDGLVAGNAVGCQLLARAQFARLPDRPLFWHLTTFPSLRDAEAAKGPQDLIAEAAGRVWLFGFGPRAQARTAGGEHVASVGPLPLPEARSYQVELYHVVMPPGAHTAVHTHPGPEAWYLLEGEQCLETPLGASRVRAGEGSVAPPGGTPMQLTNNGARLRRALFIVLHDPALPWGAPSDWRPTGACDR